MLDSVAALADAANVGEEVGDVGDPCAGIGPAADVEHDVLLAAVADGIRDFRVLRALVEPHVVAAAIVNLDEVEVPVAEVELAVLLLMACEAHADAPGMAVARAAGVVARVAVDACLQAERVDVVDECAHARGEELRVQAQVAVLAAAVPVAVVDVHILESSLLQSAVVHGVGLLADELFVDVQGKRVPRTPAHGRCALGVGSGCHGQQCECE